MPPVGTQNVAGMLTPAVLMAAMSSWSAAALLAFAQMLAAAFPDMLGDSVPVASGQVFVNQSGFVVRAGA